jgi:coenzyme F420-0:L-glutamate ligase / coenzyme F420-1:gamma-L-glutamate ligase
MILEWMQSRRSIRKFLPKMPERALLEQLIAAGITAPSASNKQPWRFLVITNPDVKNRMASAVRAAIERVAACIEPQFEEAFRAYGDYFTRFETSPVVIVPLYRPLTLLSSMTGAGLSSEDQQNIACMEQQSGIVSASLAMENILLMAHDLGLGASGLTGPLIAMDALRELLAVPAGWNMVALIAVGYPDEQPIAPARKSPADVTRWIV